jgi:hypothetical protein
MYRFALDGKAGLCHSLTDILQHSTDEALSLGYNQPPLVRLSQQTAIGMAMSVFFTLATNRAQATSGKLQVKSRKFEACHIAIYRFVRELTLSGP